MNQNGHLEIPSLLQDIENSSKFLLFRTDILQKTLLGAPVQHLSIILPVSSPAALLTSNECKIFETTLELTHQSSHRFLPSAWLTVSYFFQASLDTERNFLAMRHPMVAKNLLNLEATAFLMIGLKVMSLGCISFVEFL